MEASTFSTALHLASLTMCLAGVHGDLSLWPLIYVPGRSKTELSSQRTENSNKNLKEGWNTRLRKLSRDQWLNLDCRLQYCNIVVYKWLPCWLSSKRTHLQRWSHRRCGFDPWVRKIPWRWAWQPTPISLPGESQEQRGLAGNSP